MNTQNLKLCEKANEINMTLSMLGHAIISPSWNGTSLNTTYSYLYYVIQGYCTIQTERDTINLTAGNWYLIPSGCNFKYYCTDYMEHIYFHIQLSGTDRLDLLRHIKEPLKMPTQSFPDALLECINGSYDTLSILTVKNFAYKTIAEILVYNNISIEQPVHSECILNAISYISTHLSAGLTSNEIAENVSVSISKLTKQFRKELSMSIQEYLYNIIFSEASRLVLNTNLSFAEISDCLGFSDQFYFSRKFKEKYGVSPRNYKKRFTIT